MLTGFERPPHLAGDGMGLRSEHGEDVGEVPGGERDGVGDAAAQ